MNKRKYIYVHCTVISPPHKRTKIQLKGSILVRNWDYFVRLLFISIIKPFVYFNLHFSWETLLLYNTVQFSCSSSQLLQPSHPALNIFSSLTKVRPLLQYTVYSIPHSFLCSFPNSIKMSKILVLLQIKGVQNNVIFVIRKDTLY